MPLKKGYSKQTQAKNISTLVKDYKKSGQIGTSKPKSKVQAIKQAVAISYSIKRKAATKRRNAK